jgi:hypothetical protein
MCIMLMAATTHALRPIPARFGENDLFDVREPGPIRRRLMSFTKAVFGFTLPAPVGEGLLWGEWRCDTKRWRPARCV